MEGHLKHRGRGKREASSPETVEMLFGDAEDTTASNHPLSLKQFSKNKQ
jgi:hypothetical protein